MTMTSPRLARACVGVLSLLAGCKADAGTRHPDVEPEGPPVEDRDTIEARANLPVRVPTSGVPHTGAISLVAADPSGRAALTRDTAGGVRLWPALDGSREPIVIPVRDPRAMALADDGAGGWTLALLDAAGGARIVGVDRAGKLLPLASVPPTEFIADMVVMPGGQRLVAVGADHVVRLLDSSGRELARADRPGLRPASLRLVVDHSGTPHVAAVTAGEFDGKEARFAVEVLPLELGERSVAFATGQTIMLDSPPTFDNPALAPDGRMAVFVQRQRIGSATWSVVAKQLADGVQVSHDSGLALGVQPRIGLLANGRVLLDDGTGIGRVVDLEQRKVELIPVRAEPTINHMLEVFANGRRLAPASNWLAVHELSTDELAYLGYEQLLINSAALSPSASAVAWSLSDRVTVERIGGADGQAADALEVPGTRMHPQMFVGFVDEQHLAMIDWTGGLQVVRWSDGELLDSADLGANVNAAELRRAESGDAALLVRTQLWQNPLLVELREGEITGRYLTQGASHLVGIWSPSDRSFDAWGVWLMDGTARLHEFTFTQLREGVDTATALQAGRNFDPGMPEQLVMASDGTQLWVRTLGMRATLYASKPTQTREVLLSPGFVVSLWPSPDARRIAVVQQRDPGQLLTIYAADTLTPLWSQPMPTTMAVSWSDHAEALAIPANLGGVVFDAETGSVRSARCSLAFERKFIPPTIHGLFDQIGVCEL
jgi:hypothetical protein